MTSKSSKGWEDSFRRGTHPNGALVTVRSTDGPRPGIVVDYWPSNVYESAHYEVLVDGKILHIDTKYVAGG